MRQASGAMLLVRAVNADFEMCCSCYLAVLENLGGMKFQE
jgi:hypothetical protein